MMRQRDKKTKRQKDKKAKTQKKEKRQKDKNTKYTKRLKEKNRLIAILTIFWILNKIKKLNLIYSK